MATSVSKAFEILLARFALTEDQSSTAKTRTSGLTEFFNKEFVMAQPLLKIGSYVRNTLIRVERDIDLLAPLSYPHYKEIYDHKPQEFLYMVRNAINERYATTTVSSKKVAIKLDFSSIVVDIVPCFTRQGGGFLMPDGTGGWLATNPPYHTTLMLDANTAHENFLKPVVKLMKFWNIRNGHHLSSLHVELMTERMWRGVDMSAPPYSQLVAETLRVMPTWVQSIFPDPWGDGKAIDSYLTSSERALAIRLLKEDADNAARAEVFRKDGHVAKAFERWDVIYRKEFPAYG